MLVKIMGDKTAAAQLWNEKYKQDANDIVKMNAALLDLEDRLKQMEALA